MHVIALWSTTVHERSRAEDQVLEGELLDLLLDLCFLFFAIIYIYCLFRIQRSATTLQTTVQM